MPIEEEVASLQSLCAGARWLKADLHVHTPASKDISDQDKGATPEDVVRVANEKGLDIIAVTDHNSAAWCDSVRQAASKTPLTVFPGVEISTHQGHVMAIFDVSTPASLIEDLLIKIGFQRSQFGSLDDATDKGITDVCDAIDSAGGIAIAAHVDGERGFPTVIKVGAERKRAYAARNLWALEILDPTCRDAYQSGKGPNCVRRLACIQSSDCMPSGANKHHLDGMAQRYCLLKVDHRSLSGLKLAFIDPEMRIRLSMDQSHQPASSIVGMWVTGGFLHGQQFRFNENVSCLIGDTGAGKSVALELLRFGLDQQPRVDRIHQEVTSLLDQQMGDLGMVHILVQKGDTQYLIEREWSTPAAAPLVRRVTAQGLEQVEGELEMRLFFPTKGFSQSEIIEFAREPAVRLSLTDDLIDCTTETTTIKDLKTLLRANAASILLEQAKEQNISQQLTELPTLNEARKIIDKVLDDPKIALHQLWYTERTLLESAKAGFDSMAVKVSAAMQTLRLNPPGADDLAKLPNADLMSQLNAIYQQWQAHINALETETNARLLDLRNSIDSLRGLWESRFSKAEEEYQKLLEALDKDGVGFQALSQRRVKLQEHISLLDARQRELDTKVLPRIQQLKDDRDGLLTKLQASRIAITSKRRAKAKELTNKLGNRIRLDVRSRASTDGLRASLQALAQGSHMHAPDLDLLAKRHPIPLVKHMLARDFATLSEESTVEVAKLEKLWDTLLERGRLEDLYDLQLVDIDDTVQVMLKVSKGTYKSLEDLAHGQKCMVVLMVALAEGDFPLLVDQPEDALHAPSIEEGIVSTLRSRRGTRQCLFATRNANILVSADAEQIIALRADAQHGEVVGLGSLDRLTQRQLVIYHVEGGDDAFARRQTKYALKPVL